MHGPKGQKPIDQGNALSKREMYVKVALKGQKPCHQSVNTYRSSYSIL